MLPTKLSGSTLPSVSGVPGSRSMARVPGAAQQQVAVRSNDHGDSPRAGDPLAGGLRNGFLQGPPLGPAELPLGRGQQVQFLAFPRRVGIVLKQAVAIRRRKHRIVQVGQVHADPPVCGGQSQQQPACGARIRQGEELVVLRRPEPRGPVRPPTRTGHKTGSARARLDVRRGSGAWHDSTVPPPTPWPGPVLPRSRRAGAREGTRRRG